MFFKGNQADRADDQQAYYWTSGEEMQLLWQTWAQISLQRVQKVILLSSVVSAEWLAESQIDMSKIERDARRVLPNTRFKSFRFNSPRIKYEIWFCEKKKLIHMCKKIFIDDKFFAEILSFLLLNLIYY